MTYIEIMYVKGWKLCVVRWSTRWCTHPQGCKTKTMRKCSHGGDDEAMEWIESHHSVMQCNLNFVFFCEFFCVVLLNALRLEAEQVS